MRRFLDFALGLDMADEVFVLRQEPDGDAVSARLHVDANVVVAARGKQAVDGGADISLPQRLSGLERLRVREIAAGERLLGRFILDGNDRPAFVLPDLRGRARDGNEEQKDTPPRSGRRSTYRRHQNTKV